MGSIALLADMMARMAFWGGMSRGSRRGGSSGGAGVLIFFLGLLVAILAPILEDACDRGVLPADTDVSFLAEELIRYVIGLLHTPTLEGTGRDPAIAGDRAKRTFALWASLAATGERPAMRPSG